LGREKITDYGFFYGLICPIGRIGMIGLIGGNLKVREIWGIREIGEIGGMV